MEISSPSSLSLRSVTNSSLFHLVILICYLILQSVLVSNALSTKVTDQLALLEFKNQITSDPYGVFNSWNDTNHFCDWRGVTCSPSNQSVTGLSLEHQRLVGTLPPSIGNLTSLTALNLTNNSFHGVIPQEIGRLTKLQYLSLAVNSMTGYIPTNLTHCTDLRLLGLASNGLVGSIPDELSSLTKVFHFAFTRNNLTGTIPRWAANFSSLTVLTFARNNLHGGIPQEFERLTKLENFQISINNLSGTVPPFIYNISSMIWLSVAANRFQGRLPPDLGNNLPNIQALLVGTNMFTGPVPVSVTNASKLERLDMSENKLTGSFPKDLGRLKNLNFLNFGRNQLTSATDMHVFTSLVNCTNLLVLGLDYNRIGGELPGSIANLSSQLNLFTLGDNGISGSIPAGIGNLANLTYLGLDNNFFTGRIPTSMGKLGELQELYLAGNMLSGSIPSSFGNLARLTLLTVSNNSLEGTIPATMGNLTNLLQLDLSYNNFTGTLPREILKLSSLSVSFFVDHNSLSGPIPSEVGNLKTLGQLDFSNNKFSGEIPRSLSDCISLEYIYLGNNFLQGTIPQSLSALRSIEELNLSNNNLSGKIPEYLARLSSLKKLDLSFNDFEGEVPRDGIFADTKEISVVGNEKLCGGIAELKLLSCPVNIPRKSRKVLQVRVIIPIIIGILTFLLFTFAATYYWIKKSKRRSGNNRVEDHKSSVSYAQLLRATNGFATDNLIGVGSFGSVYKATLRENEAIDGITIVAVKVLNLEQVGASKSFIAECKALRNIRHRNLVDVLTVCSSVDSRGNDFKALVFDLMTNGNMDQWLHPQINAEPQSSLSFIQRLNIVIDVASALEYLHDQCQTTIVHCDLKPSNVLLDEDMTAHVSDFGLARIILETSQNSFTTESGLKGSIGYIPPEYGSGGHVSKYGDVYSYGILLLETFTGRRPTDEFFKDGETLRNFAIKGLSDEIEEILDPLLLSSLEEQHWHEENTKTREKDTGSSTTDIEDRMSSVHEYLVSIFRVGISCSAPLPSNRMMIGDVVRQLQDIKYSFVEFSA